MVMSIEKARLACGYSQEQVARAIGVSRPTYANVEAGKKELTIKQVEILSSMLRINIDDILGRTDGVSAFTNIMASTEKYKQIILNCIKYGAGADGKITKTKLAKLVYLADFIWYYIKSRSMSGMAYRKLPYGPVSDVFFRAIDEMEDMGLIVREAKGKAVLFSIVENDAPLSELSEEEWALIKKIAGLWKNKSTDDVVNFTHKQLPWQICRDGEIIPYGLITQEEPERVYGTIKL